MPQQSPQPPQTQPKPGLEKQMQPRPEIVKDSYRGSDKLKGKAALVTGGDSGIGRAVAVLFAREGADVAVSYLSEHSDAEETKKLVEKERRKCILFPGDVGSEPHCQQVVSETVKQLGKLDILVNNAAEQHPKEGLEQISAEQLERTFRTNIFGYFYMAKAAMPHLKEGAVIINTTSVTAYRGSGHLIDYASTKGAIVSFTRSLAESLMEKKIRVNAVAPGPVWTPLIPSTFDEKKVREFGADTPYGRPAQPSEIAPSFVFLASEDSLYMFGQVLHPNGGEIVGG
jgi:NAD(P)-dependent dehydrogenase (short-subunit alcohol dehydrogenase family)